MYIYFFFIVCIACIFIQWYTPIQILQDMFHHVIPKSWLFNSRAWCWHRWWQRSARATFSYSPGWWWNHGGCRLCRWRCFAHDIGSRTPRPCRGPMDIAGTEHLAQGHPLEQPKWLRERSVFLKMVFKVRHLYKKKRPDGHFAFRGFFVNVFWRCSTAPIEKVSNFQPPQLPAEFTPNSASF